MKYSNTVEYAQEQGYLVIKDDKIFITKAGFSELDKAVNDVFKFQLLVDTKLNNDEKTFNEFYESFSQDGLYRILLDHLQSKRESTDYELMLNGMLSFL